MRAGSASACAFAWIVLFLQGCAGLARTDRILHAAYSADLSCVAGWTFYNAGAGGGTSAVAGAGFALSAGLVKEILDLRGPGADPLDLVADLAGCVAGALLLDAEVTGD